MMNPRFGFGFMRLPLKEEEIDLPLVCQMVDRFLEAGFCYFDTAHGYMRGKSEAALRECVVKRYPRERLVLANKLTALFFKKEEDIRPLFAAQLEECGVEYFDYYLMHAQSARIFAKFKRCRAYETALELKAEGKIRHLGISFHDKAEVLEDILRQYPQIEVVQIQFNYLDYEDTAVESRKCYEVCRRHGKEVIVMEPCKGGSLVHLPPEASALLQGLGGGSSASYALRFAAGFEGVRTVLSGMGDMAQMEDNLATMQAFQPLTDAQRSTLEQAASILRSKALIACTACRYCVDGCPQNIRIPDLFACENMKTVFPGSNGDYYYHTVYTMDHGKASACIGCGKCEDICPQHLPIRSLLQQVAQRFEKPRT